MTGSRDPIAQAKRRVDTAVAGTGAGLTLLVAVASAGLISGTLIGLSIGRPIDDNTKDVLVAGFGGLLGLFTGLTVALVGFRSSRASDKVRFAREDRYRFAADKQAAYSKLLTTGDLARASIEMAGKVLTDDQMTRASDRVDEMSAAQDVTTLLGSDAVADAVDDYVNSIVDFYNAAADIAVLSVAKQGAAAGAGSAFEKAHRRVNLKRLPVLEAMRADLHSRPSRSSTTPLAPPRRPLRRTTLAERAVTPRRSIKR